MAKRKPKQQTADLETQAADEALEHDVDEETPEQERAEAAPEGLGVRVYDPNGPLDLSDPNARPGQGRHRDDELDAEYRAAQSMTGPGQTLKRTDTGDELTDAPAAPGHEHKPAEPGLLPADQIKANPFPAAKPAIETIESGRIPGAGDPQNGVVTPEGNSPISWAAPDPATAQHDENVEDPKQVARLREDPYADRPKAAPDPFAYQRNPQATQQPAPQPQTVREDEPPTDAE